MKRYIVLLLLPACTYRYETGSFTNDPHQYSQNYLTAPAIEAIPCKESTSKIEVTNKLNNETNTITTTAVSSHSQIDPCFQ
jgi:hypothetical protein